MVQEVDVCHFVRWLLERPEHVRVPRVRQREAFSVARLLCVAAATRSQSEAAGLYQLALQVLRLALDWGDAGCAEPGVALHFLRVYANSLNPDHCEKARPVLATLDKKKISAVLGQDRAGSTVLYRSSSGGAEYLPGDLMKKWPPDDLSVRLAVALAALKEAGCATSYVVLAKMLDETKGGSWTPQRIESRVKGVQHLAEVDWPRSTWKVGYWLSLSPEHQIPPEQPFRLVWHRQKRRRSHVKARRGSRDKVNADQR